MIPVYLQGLSLGLAYVAPIGMQNLLDGDHSLWNQTSVQSGNCSVGLRIHCADRMKTWACRQKSHCRRQFSMDFCP